MKLFSFLIATLTASMALGQSCDFFKKAECAASLTKLVADISSLPLPPTIDQLQAVLVNGQAFMFNCKDCLYGAQLDLLCDTIDAFVDKASDTVPGVDVDFNVKKCKKKGLVVAVKDLIDDLGIPIIDPISPVGPSSLPHAHTWPRAKASPKSSFSDKELKDFEKVYNDLYAGKPGDAPSKEELLEMIEEMNSRPDYVPAASEIIPFSCEVDVVIDTIALGLSAIGLRGPAKSVARKLYKKLRPNTQKKIIKLVKEIDNENFADNIYEVLKLIFEELSWNALVDSFSELGYWDALKFAASFAAIFASGGTAFFINIALLTWDAAQLVLAINECFF